MEPTWTQNGFEQKLIPSKRGHGNPIGLEMRRSTTIGHETGMKPQWKRTGFANLYNVNVFLSVVPVPNPAKSNPMPSLSRRRKGIRQRRARLHKVDHAGTFNLLFGKHIWLTLRLCRLNKDVCQSNLFRCVTVSLATRGMKPSMKPGMKPAPYRKPWFHAHETGVVSCPMKPA